MEGWQSHETLGDSESRDKAYKRMKSPNGLDHRRPWSFSTTLGGGGVSRRTEAKFPASQEGGYRVNWKEEKKCGVSCLLEFVDWEFYCYTYSLLECKHFQSLIRANEKKIVPENINIFSVLPNSNPPPKKVWVWGERKRRKNMEKQTLQSEQSAMIAVAYRLWFWRRAEQKHTANSFPTVAYNCIINKYARFLSVAPSLCTSKCKYYQGQSRIVTFSFLCDKRVKS